MNDEGCCACFPSWIATIPGWLIAIALLIMSFQGIDLGFHPRDQQIFVQMAVVNLIPYVLSAVLKKEAWPRVVLLLFYIVISVHIAFMVNIIPTITLKHECHKKDMKRCREIGRLGMVYCAAWSIPQLFIWYGLGQFIKSARDEKHTHSHHSHHQKQL